MEAIQYVRTDGQRLSAVGSCTYRNWQVWNLQRKLATWKIWQKLKLLKWLQRQNECGLSSSCRNLCLFSSSLMDGIQDAACSTVGGRLLCAGYWFKHQPPFKNTSNTPTSTWLFDQTMGSNSLPSLTHKIKFISISCDLAVIFKFCFCELCVGKYILCIRKLEKFYYNIFGESTLNGI